MNIGVRRRLVSELADSIGQRADHSFILHVHGIPAVQSQSPGGVVSELRRVLWSLDNRKLKQVAEDLWLDLPTEEEGDLAVADWLEDLRGAAEAEQLSLQRFTVVLEAIQQTLDDAATVAATLRREVDSGEAKDISQWEFEAHVLEVYVSPTGKRVLVELELVDESEPLAVDAALSEVRVGASLLTRILKGVSEPRVVGVINAMLNGLRLLDL